MTDDTNELLENSVANLVNAESKLTKQEVNDENGNEIQAELSAIQQSTAALNANTQAQRSYNEEKRKSITIQEAISNAYKQAGSEFENYPLSRDLLGNKNIQLQYDSNGKVSAGVNSSLSKSEKVKYLKNGGQEELDEANISLSVNDYVKQEFDSTLDEILKFKGSGEDFNQLEEDLKQAYQHLYNQLVGKAIIDFKSGAFSVKNFNPANVNPNAVLNTSLGLQQKYNYISSFEDEKIRQQNWNNVGRIESERSQAFTQIIPLMQDLENSILDVVNDNNFETKAKKAQNALKELEALFDLYSEIDPEDNSNNLEVFMKNSEYLKKIASSFRASSFAEEIDESAFRNESQEYIDKVIEQKNKSLENQLEILKNSGVLNNVARKYGYNPMGNGQISVNIGKNDFHKYPSNYTGDSKYDYYKAQRTALKQITEIKVSGIDDSKIRELRLLIEDYYKINSYINSIKSDPLKAFSEKTLVSNFEKEKSKVGYFSKKDKEGNIIDGTAAMWDFEKSRNALMELMAALNDTSKSEEERMKLFGETESVVKLYNKSLENLLTILKSVNDETTSAIKDEKAKDRTAQEKHDGNLDSFYGKKNYNYWKYAWKRDSEQQKQFIESGELPSNFSTTGNLRDSMAKTLFNKSVGYKQRQGLVGFAANVGYNKSGVGLSLLLGGFANGLKKASEAIVQFAKESVIAYGEIQSIKTNLGIVSGSQAEADQTFSQIAEYSVKSPFGVQTVSEFAVLLKQSGVYASDLMDTLKQIGDVAGGNQEKFGNIANAFSQIEANGKATTRQLRQFATAGIPVYRELSKELGVGIEQIRKMTEQGEISSQVIEKIFANMTGEGGVFENAVNIGAKTWKARQQNLADARQLAKSETGEWIIGLGGTGRGDSVAEMWLSFKEDLWGAVKNLFYLSNINDNVDNIAAQDNVIEKLQKELDVLEKYGAAPEVINAKKNQIKEASSVISDDQQRADSLVLYDSIMEKFENKILISESKLEDYWNTLSEKEIDRFQVRTVDGKTGLYQYSNQGMRGGWVESSKYTVADKERRDAEKANANYMIQNTYTQKEYEKAVEEVADVFIKAMNAKVLQLDKEGGELLDKAINKNPYDPKNKTGFYSMYQTGQSRYEQTEIGKKEKEEKEKNEWNMMLAEYDRLSKSISDTGRVMVDFGGSSKQALDLLTSGIVIFSDVNKLATETMANDWIGLINLSEEQQAIELELRKKSFDSYIKGMNETVLAMLNMSDTTDELALQLKVFKGALASASARGNTSDSIDFLNVQRANLEQFLKENGYITQSAVLSTGASNVSKGNKPRTWDEINAKSNAKDTYPLWQRILNQSFGTSLDLFKNGAITRGDQAVNLWAAQQQRETIKNVSRAMLNTMNVRDTFDTMGLGRKNGANYIGGNYVIGNTSGNGVTQINWQKTYKSIGDFAMSIESAAEVTRAYSDSLQSDVDTLRDFISSAFTITEDAANVYDPEYQKHLGDLSKNIKALDANAYDMMFEVDEDSGMLKLRENATSAAQALLEEKQTMLTFASAVANAKDAVKNLEVEMRGITLERDLNLGKYQDYEKLKDFKTSAGKEAVIAYIDEELDRDEWKPVLKNLKLSGDNPEDLEQRKNYLKESYLQGKEIFGGTVKNKRKEDIEKQLENLDETTLQTQLKAAYEKAFQFYSDWKTSDEHGNEIQANGKTRAENWKNFTPEQQERDFNDFGLQASSGYAAREYLDKKAKLDEYYSLQKELQAMGDDIGVQNVFEALDSYITTLLRKEGLTKQSEYSTGFKNLASNNIEEGKVDKDYLKSSLAFGKDIYQGNNYAQQNVLDFMGVSPGTSFKDWFETLFVTEKRISDDEKVKKINEEDKKPLIDFIDKAAQSASGLDYLSMRTSLGLRGQNSEEMMSALDRLQNGESFGDIIDNTSVETAQTLLEIFGNIEAKTKNVKEIFESLGKQIEDTLVNSFSSGFTGTFETMGKHMKSILKDTNLAADSAKDYEKVWKNVAQEMLNSLGPAMTQAGLSLITKGSVGEGMALIAAGGILSFMSGMLNDDDDKSKDEENRIKTLKDLLADLIDQVKTDAQYYEKNFKHENAISEANKISVNDAIITPNGNVVSTHPDDYLIATKTPGSLIGSGKGDTIVNFTMIDQSQKGVNVRTEQKENEDGSVDIIAIVTDAVSQAIADGQMDDAFAARDYRMNGNKYTY